VLHAVNRPQDAVVRAPSRPRRETSGRAAHAHGRSARVGQAETVADAVKCNDTVLTEFFRDAERAAPPHPRLRSGWRPLLEIVQVGFEPRQHCKLAPADRARGVGLVGGRLSGGDVGRA